MDYIHQALLKFGISTSIKGFGCLHDAIEMALEEPEILSRITKGLYPAIADKHNTTPSRVDRVMRHAIEKACNNSTPDLLFEYFGNSIGMNKGKPTNSEFIATMCLQLTKKLKEGSK